MAKRKGRNLRLRHEEEARAKRDELARQLREVAGEDAGLEADQKPGSEEFQDDSELPSGRFTIMRPLSDDVEMTDILDIRDLLITNIERRIIERPAEMTRVEIDLEVAANPIPYFTIIPDRRSGRDQYVFNYEGTIYLVIDMEMASTRGGSILDAGSMMAPARNEPARIQVRGEAQITEDQVILPPHLRRR